MKLAYKHIDGLELKVNRKNRRRKDKGRKNERKRKNKNVSKEIKILEKI